MTAPPDPESNESNASRARTWIGLAGWILVCFAASAVGALTPTGLYAELRRPAWAPPGWLFGVVWPALYLLLAVAAWRVWLRGGFARQASALALFFVQLAFNAAWTWIFFGLEALGAAVVEIVALWILIVATIVAFRRVDGVAAALLLPYLAWVTFATALATAIWRLNP